MTWSLCCTWAEGGGGRATRTRNLGREGRGGLCNWDYKGDRGCPEVGSISKTPGVWAGKWACPPFLTALPRLT